MKLTGFKLTSLILAGVIGLLLWKAFVPGFVQHSNDGPLGRLMSQCHQLPQRFTGCWQDLDVVGYREGSAIPNISFTLQWLLRPVLFSKFYAAMSLMLLGLAAWTFFRQLKFSMTAANLGAVAAVLNGSFFSAACWGAGAHVITVAMAFFAMAALVNVSGPRGWIRVVLAGMALGMAVSEGADVGALFSALVAAFALWQGIIGEGRLVARVGLAGLQVIIMAGCAAWLASAATSELVSNDIQSAAILKKDARKQWNWATQWSFPKSETLSFVVPGLFGYRDDTEGGGEYWGSIGRDPNWDEYVNNGEQGEPPTGFRRYSGGGVYAGVAVALLALWACAQSIRRENSALLKTERRWIWFWMIVAFVALLLAFGRFAPFYRAIYALPYVSTVRNPAKFTHIVSFALVVMFAYAIESGWRRYVRTQIAAGPKSRPVAIPVTGRFEKHWIWGCAIAFGVCFVATIIYAANRPWLEHYLQTVQFREDDASLVSAFSIRQPWWFLFFFAVASIFTTLLVKGSFRGKIQHRAAVVLGVILLIDLGRANQPWIIFWDYQDKYASNAILDILRDTPYTHRVAMLPFQAPKGYGVLRQVYKLKWSQHSFPYYNIQATDVVQAPRIPDDISRFDEAFHSDTQTNRSRLFTRGAELTNTRYLLGITDPGDTLNDNYDPELRRYRTVQRFDFVPKPGVLRDYLVDDFNVVPDENGKFSLFEFTGALPRAKLYSRWQIRTNHSQTLEQLTSASFDPAQSVIVEPENIQGALPNELRGADLSTNSEPTGGTVQFTSYAPKRVKLFTEAKTPTVLLLNDHYDPAWKAKVDGAAAALFRCNYLMQGLYLPAGAHEIEFSFQRTLRPLWISLSAIAVSLVLIGILIAFPTSSRSAAEPSKASGVPIFPEPKPALPAQLVKPKRTKVKRQPVHK